MEMENVIGVQTNEKSRFLGRTYGWMALALLISAAGAFVTMNCLPLLKFLFGGSSLGFIVFAVAELALVFWLSSSIRKISVAAATAGFITYAAINGITLSSIFFVYRIDSIASAFLGCSAMFGVLCVYGSRTSKDLTTVGRYCSMALIGIIVASLVQFVLSLFTHARFTMLDMLISFATVVVFTGLSAYDAQKVLRTAGYATSSDDYKKVSILGALTLYLDFINLFLALLRIFGKRR